MTASGLSRCLLGALLLVAASHLATARPRTFTVFDLVEQSEFVVSGTVLVVGEESARVALGRVLRGELAAEEITVSPIHVLSDMGRILDFRVGDEAALFLTRADDGSFTVVASGEGKVGLKPDTRESDLEAIERLIEIAALQGEDAENRAMLAEATAANPLLRAEAHRYIAVRLSHSNLRERYKDDLVALLRHEDDDVRLAALSALRYVRAEEALPLIIEATRDDNLRIVDNASLALAQYDTAESVAALIALTAHADPNVRVRAAIDLDASRRPEAKEALRRLLDDPDPKVRAHAPKRFVYLLRRREADDVIPKLISMLDDPVDEVQVGAAQALGESLSPLAVRPLLDVLRREDLTADMRDWSVKALECLCIKAGAGVCGPIQENLDLITEALKSGQWHASFGAVVILGQIRTPQAVAALQWAADNHPREDIRAHARRSLARP